MNPKYDFHNITAATLKFEYRPPQGNNGGIVFVNKKTEFGSPTWKCPENMRVPFGIKTPETEGQKTRVAVEVPENSDYHQWLENLDEILIDELTKNSIKYFKGQAKKRDVIKEGFYSSIVKQNDPKWPPLMTFRIIQDKGEKGNTKFYEEDGINDGKPSYKKSTIDCIDRNATITAHLKLVGMYFAGSQVYPLINALALFVSPSSDVYSESDDREAFLRDMGVVDDGAAEKRKAPVVDEGAPRQSPTKIAKTDPFLDPGRGLTPLRSANVVS